MKLVVFEPGSDLASELWGTSLRAASSVLCYPEGRAALAGARRAQRLRATDYGQALREFESLHDELVLVGIDRLLAQRAGELAEQFGLRGYDAVHLASAIALGPDTTMATWDADLARAAAECGCAVAGAL